MMHPMLRPVRTAALIAGLVLVGSACHNLDFSPRHKPGEIDIYDDLFSISVPDVDHAIAVGYHGSAYWTADGGEHWGKGDTDTPRSLYSVSMADVKHGWAVGQRGLILRTDDGGLTWTSQPNLKMDEDSHLFSVHAVDSQTAWAVGEWGARIKTSDGGQTWVDHSLGVGQSHPMFVWLSPAEQEKVRRGEKVYEDVGLNDVYCLPPPSQSCWIVGEFGYIFRSDDGGDSWERGEIIGEIHLDPIVLPYNVIEITAEDRKKIRDFASQIADENYLNIQIDAFASPKEIANFGRLEDPTELFDILEARMSEARVVLEEAGILTDRLRMPNKPPWDYEDFVEDDPDFLKRYLKGRTADKPMIRVGVIQNPYLFDVYFENENEGLISGLGGVLMRSEDGGRTWHYHSAERKQAVFAVSGKGQSAVAVGEKGLVVFSDDAGLTWHSPTDSEFPPVFTFMRDLGFDREHRLGYIVGQEGMVLRTRDGGKSWVRVLGRSA
jgi:photosystem II stability/assembly factor-like uncharacterized protein